jgi:hypothetical protein
VALTAEILPPCVFTVCAGLYNVGLRDSIIPRHKSFIFIVLHNHPQIIGKSWANHPLPIEPEFDLRHCGANL